MQLVIVVVLDGIPSKVLLAQYASKSISLVTINLLKRSYKVFNLKLSDKNVSYAMFKFII